MTHQALSLGKYWKLFRATLSPHQTIAALLGVWSPCCDMLDVVGSNLTICKLEPTAPNKSKHVAQHAAPNNVAICCVAMLGSFDPGLTSG